MHYYILFYLKHQYKIFGDNESLYGSCFDGEDC